MPTFGNSLLLLKYRKSGNFYRRLRMWQQSFEKLT